VDVVRKAIVSKFTKPLEVDWEKVILRRQFEMKAEAICGKMGMWRRYLVKASVVMEKRPANRLAALDALDPLTPYRGRFSRQLYRS
jgi:hypothetical protein